MKRFEVIKISFNEIYLKIIKILEENSKLTFKEIREKVHMTGQAVGLRIHKLIEEVISEKFTIHINKQKLDITNISFIKISMNSYDHTKIKEIISKYDEIVDAFRISSDCCYLLKIEATDNDFLNFLLDEITTFANYQLSMSISKIK